MMTRPRAPHGARPLCRAALRLLAAGLALVALCLAGCSRDEATGTGAEGAAPPEIDGEHRQVTLFFQGIEEDLLVPEEAEIVLTETLAGQVEQVFDLLARGPQGGEALPTIPPETKLRQLFLVGDEAILDLSAEVTKNHPGGSWAEMATIYSLTNSVAFNFPSIRRVKLIVEGNEAGTLAGHVGLARSFRLDLTLVGQMAGREMPAPEPEAGGMPGVGLERGPPAAGGEGAEGRSSRDLVSRMDAGAGSTQEATLEAGRRVTHGRPDHLVSDDGGKDGKTLAAGRSAPAGNPAANTATEG